MSDSENDTVHFVEEQGVDKKKTSQKKRKAAADTPRAAPKNKKLQQNYDIFGLLSEDEEGSAVLNSQQGSQLVTSITSRVANGIVRRAKNSQGEYYAELRVYTAADAASKAADRWKKALVCVKTSINSGTPQWDHLQKVIKLTKNSLMDVDSKFYGDYFNFK